MLRLFSRIKVVSSLLESMICLAIGACPSNGASSDFQLLEQDLNKPESVRLLAQHCFLLLLMSCEASHKNTDYFGMCSASSNMKASQKRWIFRSVPASLFHVPVQVCGIFRNRIKLTKSWRTIKNVSNVLKCFMAFGISPANNHQKSKQTKKWIHS